jgi:hypothetical protein
MKNRLNHKQTGVNPKSVLLNNFLTSAPISSQFPPNFSFLASPLFSVHPVISLLAPRLTKRKMIALDMHTKFSKKLAKSMVFVNLPTVAATVI